MTDLGYEWLLDAVLTHKVLKGRLPTIIEMAEKQAATWRVAQDLRVRELRQAVKTGKLMKVVFSLKTSGSVFKALMVKHKTASAFLRPYVHGLHRWQQWMVGARCVELPDAAPGPWRPAHMLRGLLTMHSCPRAGRRHASAGLPHGGSGLLSTLPSGRGTLFFVPPDRLLATRHMNLSSFVPPSLIPGEHLVLLEQGFAVVRKTLTRARACVALTPTNERWSEMRVACHHPLCSCQYWRSLLGCSADTSEPCRGYTGAIFLSLLPPRQLWPGASLRRPHSLSLLRDARASHARTGDCTDLGPQMWAVQDIPDSSRFILLYGVCDTFPHTTGVQANFDKVILGLISAACLLPMGWFLFDCFSLSNEPLVSQQFLQKRGLTKCAALRGPALCARKRGFLARH